MSDDKKVAQVTGGVNDDISELKSLTTLRKRVISDGELVSKSNNGFRLAHGPVGVIFRTDENGFYILTTPSGQAQDGQWNTLRPLSVNLTTGRVSLQNGVDISGGAMISHNAGVSTQMTGPSPLINGQIYDSAPLSTQFTSGNITTQLLMNTRVVANKEDYGLISYRDWQGNWNEMRIKANGELNVGQLVKRNIDGWIRAEGNNNVNNNADRNTNGLRIQGNSDLFADLYHYERIGKHHFLGLHVANGGANGWYEFRNDGQFFANNSLHAGDATLATDGNVSGARWGGWLTDWLNNAFAARDNNINTRATFDYVNNSNTPIINAANRGAIDGRLQWWLANQAAGSVGTCGLFYNVSGHDVNPNDIIPGYQLRWSSAGERQGGAPDGSWRALGTANASKGRDGDEVTLYVRVS